MKLIFHSRIRCRDSSKSLKKRENWKSSFWRVQFIHRSIKSIHSPFYQSKIIFKQHYFKVLLTPSINTLRRANPYLLESNLSCQNWWCWPVCKIKRLWWQYHQLFHHGNLGKCCLFHIKQAHFSSGGNTDTLAAHQTTFSICYFPIKD